MSVPHEPQRGEAAEVKPRKKAWSKWLALGCGVPVVLVAAFLAIMVFQPNDAPMDIGNSLQSTLVPSTPPQYTGDWMGDDGTTVSIRAGDSTVISEKQRTLKSEGSNKIWKIDQIPHDDNGTWKMRLSGRLFQRQGGFDPDGSMAADGVPSDKALRALTQQTLLDFYDGATSKNFKRFHATLATPFKDQTKPQQFNEAFKELIAQKLDIRSIQSLPPVFTSKPGIDGDGYLSLQGRYPTRPSQVNFALKYYRENNTWKLIRIDINTDNL